jgi:methionine-rich copper-binding protein CopC
MFNQASAFNQNLTGWDVSYFSAQPSNFSAYATSWVSSNQPDWGYPGLASTNPVDDAAGIALNSNITLTFSEDIQAGTGNITLFKSDGTIVQAFDVSSDVSISSATITLVPTADLISETSYYIQVDATTVEDLSSNAFPGIADSTTLNFTAGSDTTLPTLVSSNPSDDATGIALSSNITLNFSETIQAGTGNITLFNSDGTIFQAFDVTSDVSIFQGSVTVNPTAQLSLGGSYYIQVDATAIEDLSSNPFAGIADNTTLNFAAVADTVTPTVTLTSTTSVFSGLFTVTAAFSEAVTGFEVGDITVGNGSASNFDDTAAPVYTFDVTPTADGAVTVDVAGSVAIDAAGNNNTAATQLSVTYDPSAPTVTLTGPSDEVVTDGFTVTARFSEVVTGLLQAEITVPASEGTVTGLSGSGAVYTITINPILGQTVNVSIAANQAQDVAGNGNTASNTFSIQAGSPPSAFEERKEVVEVAVKTEVQKALTTNLAANQRMLSAGMGRFVANKRSISSGQPQVNLFIPFDVDGNASYSDRKLKANGDFFALSSTNDGKSQKAVFGDFDVISDSDGNTSGYFNGRFAIETTVSDDLMLAYFAGASIGRALMDGTFKGSQNSYGLSVGGYFVRSFNDTVYVNGFASLGQSNHKLEIADDTLDLNSSYSTRTATLGGTVTGVMPQAGYEIWPELGFTYANTKVGTMDFTGTAYGLTADNLSLDGGAVEMGNVSFAPQFKVQFSEALIEDYASTFSITPKVTCEKVRNTTTTKGCGTGATMGLQSASDDGMTNLNVGFEYADVNNLKRRSLKLSVEHRF